jgi:HlyD family secretion protein
MKNNKIILIGIALVSIFSSCNSDENNFDASGSFEATETIISSEAAGTLNVFDMEEGETVKEGQVIGYVDSTQLHLKKKQLEEQIASMLSKKPNISLQLAAFETQLNTANNEKSRIEKLVKANAATTKQLDDVHAQILVIESQVAALKSTLLISSQGITNDANTISIQIEQINDQLKKCRIISPMNGTVLITYARKYEMTAPGKPLYKLADLNEIILRVYISGDQLSQVKLNQEVRVFTDDGKGELAKTNGKITWISNKGEFTPKTIQTKDERANMVYAMKIKVKNLGDFKIGMYGEIKFI